MLTLPAAVDAPAATDMTATPGTDTPPFTDVTPECTTPAEQSDAVPQVQHQFTAKTFRSPHYCRACNKLLWGVSRQGLSCQGCGIAVHQKCLVQLDSQQCDPATPPTPPSRSLRRQRRRSAGDMGDMESTQVVNVVEAEAEQGELYQSPAIAASTSALGRSTSSSALSGIRKRTRHRRTAAVTEIKITSPEVSQSSPVSPTLLGLGVLHDLMATTAEKAAELERMPKGPAPLNVLTTLPRNFTRFVTKVGPLGAFHNKIEAIFRWDTPSETMLAMAVWVILCLKPILLLFAPHMLLFGVLVWGYYAKLKTQSTKPALKKKPSTPKPIDPRSFRPDQIHYRKNIQFIQNTMGLYCDAYENVCLLQTKVDWSNEEETRKVLYVGVGSFTGLFVLQWVVPVQYLLLFGGISAFVANTAVGKALQSLALSYAQQHSQGDHLQRLWHTLRQRFDNDDKGDAMALLDALPEIHVELYENQRWWSGLGWITHLLRNERSSWSNRDGTVGARSKDAILDPAALIEKGMALAEPTDDSPLPSALSRAEWEWTSDGEWEVDMFWHPRVDADGWLYSDQHWKVNGASDGDNSKRVTRQRRWIRCAQLLRE